MVKSRLFVLLALAVTSLPAVACTSATEEEEGAVEESGDAITASVAVGTVLKATRSVNLREEASTSSRSIRVLPAGASVTAVESRPVAGFYRVKHEGAEGWVFGNYLEQPGAPRSSEQGGYSNSKNVKIVYQGSCDFLHRCDSWSRRLPVGQVNWGCLGRGDVCVDSEHWLSGPSRAYCGKTVKICQGSTCTTGKIMDVSVSQDFEASQGVLDALGIGYGGGSTCSNTYLNGNPNVTVYW